MSIKITLGYRNIKEPLFLALDEIGVRRFDLALLPAGGNVGIGTTNPALRLHVYNSSGNIVRFENTPDGYCEGKPSAGSMGWTCSSDIKLKQNITSLTKEQIQKIVNKFMGFPIKQFTIKASNETKIGVVAQDLQITNPELVSDMGNGTLGVTSLNDYEMLLFSQYLYSENLKLKSQMQELCQDKTYSWCK